MDEKCNGWTNYETWCVHLWLTNDQGSEQAARDCPTAEALQEWVEEFCYLNEASLRQNLINTGLRSADWREIFEALHADEKGGGK